MSAETFSISISGDSNDSNLVLSSASASIVDGADGSGAHLDAAINANLLTVKSDVTTVKSDVTTVKAGVVNVQTGVDSNATELAAIMAKLSTFSVAERDLLDVIKDRGFIRVGYKSQNAFPGVYDNSNVNQLGFTSSGFIPDLAKAIAQAIFGEDTFRILDVSGVKIQDGVLEIVRVETPTRFSELNADKYDVVLHFPTQTIDRNANQGAMFSNPMMTAFTRTMCNTEDLSGASDLSLNSNYDTFKFLEEKLGHIRYGTADNCTALVWGQVFKQEYPDISMSIVIGSSTTDLSNGNIDVYTSDDYYIAYLANTNARYSLIASAPTGSVLDLRDWISPALKKDQKNNNLMSVINTVLNIQLAAVDLDISSGNVDSVTSPASSSALNNLLFGTNLGGTFNSYTALGMVADAGKKVLQYGNAAQRMAYFDEPTGITDFAVRAVPSWGMVGLVTNSK